MSASSREIPVSSAFMMMDAGQPACIDVRSESEFSQGQIPCFKNFPVLNDSERHLVGHCYHHEGAEAATALGMKLVAPHRHERLDGWLEQIGLNPLGIGLITCWRGGLRSRLVCAALAEAGAEVLRVAGGYKAMRHELLHTLSLSPAMTVVAGLTGSGKTRLISQAAIDAKIDLENLAVHRGSSFGAVNGIPQPSLATFENNLAWHLRKGHREILVEDESRMIGRITLPENFAIAMRAAKVVYLEADLQQRAENIFEEYVQRPMDSGVSKADIARAAASGIRQIEKKLGGLVAGQLISQSEEAFAAMEPEAHYIWIKGLLAHYYDRIYQQSFLKHGRSIVFKGDFHQCSQWISRQFA